MNNIIINPTIFKGKIPLSISVCNNLSEIDLDIIINGAKSAMEKCITGLGYKESIEKASCTLRYYGQDSDDKRRGAIKDIKLYLFNGEIIPFPDSNLNVNSDGVPKDYRS